MTKRTPNIKKFKEKAEKLLDKFENLIKTMPQKGNTSSTCQKTLLQLHINEVHSALNGMVQVDLEEGWND